MGFYTLKVAGLERQLPKVKINDKLSIASFVMFGDTELIEKCSEAIYNHVDFPLEEIDILVCPEAKAIPLTHSLAVRSGLNYVIARKSVKVYMVDPIIQKVQSITTLEDQNLVLDRIDVENIVGKKVCIVDDVVSTGGSLNALQILLEKINCEVTCKAAVLLEEAGYDKDDLLYLERLPIFPELE